MLILGQGPFLYFFCFAEVLSYYNVAYHTFTQLRKYSKGAKGCEGVNSLKYCMITVFYIVHSNTF